MLVEDIRKIEAEYFDRKSDMAVPELLCAYFEQKEYEFVYFISKNYVTQFWEAGFYNMMSLVIMGYTGNATVIYKKYKDDWFNLFKQYNIYWKHIVLFALLFKEFDIPLYYQAIFDEYFENPMVQLLEMAQTEPVAQLIKTGLFRSVERNYPVIRSIWQDSIRKNKTSVLAFEDVQWNIWKRQNDKIGNGVQYGIEQIYKDNVLKIYSYKPKTVSASMHIITDGENTVVLDCGCEISGDNIIRINVKEILSLLGISSIDAVFLSHAHMDHYGSLNEIRKYPVYMTEITKSLVHISSPDIALGNAKLINEYSGTDISGIYVRFIPNGHIPGSVMMDINWKNYKRIVYTGDYSVEDQCTVQGFKAEDLKASGNGKIDILITETTFGDRPEVLSHAIYEKIFVKYCRKQLQYGNKIIIPCSAAGGAQEVAMLLSGLASETGAKILVDGMAAAITQYYQILTGKNILSKNISVCNQGLGLTEKIFNNNIILASSGMIKEGSTSAMYIKELMDKEKVCVIKTGFISETGHLFSGILNRANKNIHYADIPLLEHAGYKSLIETTEKLAPDCVLYVHGTGIKIY